MRIDLIDSRMADGSRHFGDLPATQDWYAVRAHVAALPGAALTEFICDGVTEAWIDPACPDSVIATVLTHFAALLCPTA